MATPTVANGLKVFTAFSGFYYTLNYWIGYSHTPPAEHLFHWTFFWTSCCFVCTYYAYPWPFVGGVIAWTGLMKNLGMLWSSCPIQEIRSAAVEAWPSWIAALILTILATGSTSYRVLTAQWNRNMAVRSVSLDEEAK
jgi:hypothetical protein